MTDVGHSRPARPTRKGDVKGGNPISRFLASIRLFVSQILDEMRKVVRPTRTELWNYTAVVILFVSLMMAIVAGLDFGFSKLVSLMFGT